MCLRYVVLLLHIRANPSTLKIICSQRNEELKNIKNSVTYIWVTTSMYRVMFCLVETALFRDLQSR